MEDIRNILSEPLPWDTLKGKTVLVTGATGIIPGYIIHVLMNIGDIRVIALSRSKKKLQERFSSYLDNPYFERVDSSITSMIDLDYFTKKKTQLDIILHGAGNTDRIGQQDMVNTIDVNVIGTKYCLEFLAKQGFGIFMPFSSASIFGKTEYKKVSEDEYGYTDLQASDAPYVQSKRFSEVYSYTYHKQFGTDVIIPRIPWTIAPGLERGNGVRSDFLYDLLDNNELIIRSDGMKTFPFSYISDVVSALFYILFKGVKGDSYNIVSDDGNLTVRDFAEIHINALNVKQDKRPVLYVANESGEGNPGIMIDNAKIRSLGWNSKISISDGVRRVYEYIIKQYRD
jgi:nucleoside-diphosphate-sugar epimerase